MAVASCDSGENNTLSLLRSRKEKLRRKRIKNCYEQLRALLPHGEGTKDDVASVLEATVDYVRYLQERLPRDVTSQIAKTLQKNRSYSKGRRSKNKVPPLFSPVSRNSAASIKVMRSGEKTELSTNKTMGLLLSTTVDCCPTEQTFKFLIGAQRSVYSCACGQYALKRDTCQQDETVQPNYYMPVLFLPVMTSLLRLPSLFCNEDAVQESGTNGAPNEPMAGRRNHAPCTSPHPCASPSHASLRPE